MWHLQYIAKKVCEATRTLRLASQRFLKLRLRGFMIIKPLQEGLPELLREATRSEQTFNLAYSSHMHMCYASIPEAT